MVSKRTNVNLADVSVVLELGDKESGLLALGRQAIAPLPPSAVAWESRGLAFLGSTQHRKAPGFSLQPFTSTQQGK